MIIIRLGVKVKTVFGVNGLRYGMIDLARHPVNTLDPLQIGREVLTTSGPNDSSTPACFWTRSVQPKPDQDIQIGSMLVLYSMIQAFFGRTEPDQMQEVGSCSILAARWPYWS